MTTPNVLGSIVFQASDNSEIRELLESLLAEQTKTNALLERLVEKNDPPALLDHKAAAKFLGIPVGSLYNLVHEEKIAVVKAGSKNLFRRSDLEDWIKARRKPER